MARAALRAPVHDDEVQQPEVAVDADGCPRVQLAVVARDHRSVPDQLDTATHRHPGAGAEGLLEPDVAADRQVPKASGAVAAPDQDRTGDRGARVERGAVGADDAVADDDLAHATGSVDHVATGCPAPGGVVQADAVRRHHGGVEVGDRPRAADPWHDPPVERVDHHSRRTRRVDQEGVVPARSRGVEQSPLPISSHSQRRAGVVDVEEIGVHACDCVVRPEPLRQRSPGTDRGPADLVEDQSGLVEPGGQEVHLHGALQLEPGPPGVLETRCHRPADLVGLECAQPEAPLGRVGQLGQARSANAVGAVPGRTGRGVRGRRHLVVDRDGLGRLGKGRGHQQRRRREPEHLS